jgi:hexosaminidase
MIYKQYALLVALILTGMQGVAQVKMGKLDSVFVAEKMTVQPIIAKGTSNYKMPVAPDGFSLQLIGSDNLSVITKSGTVFTPLNDMTVNLLFKYCHYWR